MTIAEMHVWFRQYAQQMGMQNVRAILPEQIDNLINTSIKDTIDEIVRANVGTTNDRVITDNSKLANINALRTLYKVKTIQPSGVDADKPISQFGNENYSFTSDNIENALYFVDFSIRYVNATDSTKKTRWFPIRIIDDSYLADVLNDWVLAPRMRTPVMVVYKAETSAEATLDADIISKKHIYDTKLTDYTDALTAYNTAVEGGDASEIATAQAALTAAETALNTAKTAYDNAIKTRNDYANTNVETTKFDIYFGENDSITTVASSNKMSEIRCSYIKKPNKVQYLSDIGGTNIDSDLPEQLQIPMLKHAVDLYRASVSGNLFANQENAKEQQRENVRNNVRPDNDGYQS